MNPVMGALFAVLGFLVLFGTLLHLTVRGLGGWRAVGRGLRRQAALTAAAFTAPVRSQLRFRRRRRLLVQLLGRPDGLRLAERAAAQAAAVDPGVTPYGALLDPAYVGVLVASAPGVPRPPEPWIVDDDNPRLWWLEHADVAPYLMGPSPLLVTLGADDEHVVLLDVLSGPATVAVQGDARLARAVVASIGAQLDARLPRGAVTVSEGVHDRHPGPDPAGTATTAHHWATSGVLPGFAVCAAAPPQLPADVRLIAAGTVRGTARLVVAHADGIVDVHGTPLRADAIALPRALASVLRSLPPYTHQAGPGSDLTETPAAPPYPPPQRRATDLAEVPSREGDGERRPGGEVPVADAESRSGGVLTLGAEPRSSGVVGPAANLAEPTHPPTQKRATDPTEVPSGEGDGERRPRGELPAAADAELRSGVVPAATGVELRSGGVPVAAGVELRSEGVPVAAGVELRSGGVVAVSVVGAGSGVGAGSVVDGDLVELEEPGRPSGVSASAS